jgi:hypothetical protein
MAKTSRAETISGAEARKLVRHGAAGFEGELPAGWAYLFAYWAPKPVVDARKIKHWVHDKVLCPEHALALDALLREIPAVVTSPAQGEA